MRLSDRRDRRRDRRRARSGKRVLRPLRGSRDRGPGRRRGCGAGGNRAALTRVRELRPVRGLRAPRRGIQEAGAEPFRVKRGHLESNVLVLVTLALVAFGMVMVYSATSASATIGGGSSVYYLKRQA